MPSRAAECEKKKIILSATRGQNLPQRPFAAVQPSDLILQICGENPTRGRSHLRLFKPILVTHFFMQNISQGSLPSEELLSTAKEKKKESREQRENVEVVVVGGCDDVTGLSGNTALLKSRKKHPDPHLSHPHPGATHTQPSRLPPRGEKRLHPTTEYALAKM